MENNNKDLRPELKPENLLNDNMKSRKRILNIDIEMSDNIYNINKKVTIMVNMLAFLVGFEIGDIITSILNNW
jgi:hypothetical protein